MCRISPISDKNAKSKNQINETKNLNTIHQCKAQTQFGKLQNIEEEKVKQEKLRKEIREIEEKILIQAKNHQAILSETKQKHNKEIALISDASSRQLRRMK